MLRSLPLGIFALDYSLVYQLRNKLMDSAASLLESLISMQEVEWQYLKMRFYALLCHSECSWELVQGY